MMEEKDELKSTKIASSKENEDKQAQTNMQVT